MQQGEAVIGYIILQKGKKKRCKMGSVTIADGKRQVDLKSANNGSAKDEKNSNSFQAALNAELPLPGGSDFRLFSSPHVSFQLLVSWL